MVKTTLWRALDKVLEPVGFVMSGRNWERLVGQYRDHIHLQTVSGSGTRAYVATTDTVSDSILDSVTPPEFVGKIGVLDVVSVDVGDFLGPYSRYWRATGSGPADLAKVVVDYGLPFLDQQHTFDGMKERLERTAIKWRDPTSRFHLAIMLHRAGRNQEALDLMADPPRRITGPWMARVEGLRALFSGELASGYGKSVDG